MYLGVEPGSVDFKPEVSRQKIQLSILILSINVLSKYIVSKNIRNFFLSFDRNLNTRSAIAVPKRDDLKRKTSILRKINPSDCSFKPLGNQNLFLHWGIFAENFPETILQKLHNNNTDDTVDVRRSFLYKEEVSFDVLRIGLGHKPFHLVDFHDVPDSM